MFIERFGEKNVCSFRSAINSLLKEPSFVSKRISYKHSAPTGLQLRAKTQRLYSFIFVSSVL